MPQQLDKLIDEIKGCREAAEELYLLFDHAYRNREKLTDLFRLSVREAPEELQGESGFLAGVCSSCHATLKSELPPETLFCSTCEAPSPESLAHAIRSGWTCIIDDEGNLEGNYAGRCPICSENLKVESTVTSCESCDASSDELTQAVIAGWSNLRENSSGLSWCFLGLCPACQAEQKSNQGRISQDRPRMLFD